MLTATPPKMFIGSSIEGQKIARALGHVLGDQLEISIWSGGVFGLGEGTLQALLKAAATCDFATLVLTPDDMTISRNSEVQSPRDNVIFEAGLFMGILGSSRTFLVFDSTKSVKIPTDLAGITLASYRGKRSDDDIRQALEVGCHPIRVAVERLGLRTRSATRDEGSYSLAAVWERHQEIFRVLPDGQLQHRWYPANPQNRTPDQDRWSDWTAMKSQIATSVAAVSGRERLDVFILTNAGRIAHRSWSLDGDPALAVVERSGYWSDWQDLPNNDEIVIGPITAIGREPGHLEIFAYNEHREIIHRWAWNHSWSNWHRFG